jgi:hypothetical protein
MRDLIEVLNLKSRSAYRPVKPITHKRLKSLLADSASEALRGTLVRCTNSIEIHVHETGPAAAMEMTRFRDVQSFCFGPENAQRGSNLVLPLQLLLRGWCSSLQAVKFDVLVKNHQAHYLAGCHREVRSLQQLIVFNLDSVSLSEPNAEALAALPTLSTVFLNRCEFTGACLEALCCSPALTDLFIDTCPSVPTATIDKIRRKRSDLTIRVR